MRSRKLSVPSTFIFGICLLTAFVAVSPANAQTETILQNLSNNGDGELPYSGLIFDWAGNLYGTTTTGGTYGQGTVFQLSPSSSGGWTMTTLHSFGNGSDGQSPWGGALLMDTAGNLYGATLYGGTQLCNDSRPVGCGTVFKMVPNADGSWTEKVIHNFSGGGVNGNGPNGYHPYGGLAMDAAGNLYGTTLYGGTYGSGGTIDGGTVFELSPSKNGNWKEELLWSFGGGDDGNLPQCTPVFDKAGNLYGTTSSGGRPYDGGTVFELSPGSNGWTETIIFNFDAAGNSATGEGPLAGVVFDAAGNLYGTTAYGGTFFRGNVFELTPKASHGWKETVLHTFTHGDGETPDAGVTVDAAGNVYGTAFMGGAFNAGIVYKLSQSAGTWSETILHSFNNEGGDGTNPAGSLVLDSDGNLYGTTYEGGSSGDGTIFEITP